MPPHAVVTSFSRPAVTPGDSAWGAALPGCPRLDYQSYRTMDPIDL